MTKKEILKEIVSWKALCERLSRQVENLYERINVIEFQRNNPTGLNIKNEYIGSLGLGCFISTMEYIFDNCIRKTKCPFKCENARILKNGNIEEKTDTVKRIYRFDRDTELFIVLSEEKITKKTTKNQKKECKEKAGK